MSRHQQSLNDFYHPERMFQQAVHSQGQKAFNFQQFSSDIPSRGISPQRNWQASHYRKPSKIPQQAFNFTLMSYNILSQVLLEQNSYVYQKCKRQHLSWRSRLPKLLEELKQHSADVICLQEVDEDVFFEVFEPFLQHCGYKGVYKKKTGDRTDGCAIFYKVDVFGLEKYVGIEFQNDTKIPSLSRPNVGLVALLHPKYDNTKKICVATTHLLYNPKRGDIKLAQLCILLAEVEKVAHNKQADQNVLHYWPILLCGDMNSVPFSPLYNFITKGSIKYHGLAPMDISGQIPAYHNPHRKVLLPSSIDLKPLGIHSEAKYVNTKQKRKSQSCNALHLSDDDCSSFHHGFKFKSAYKHFGSGDKKEISTFNNNTSLNVDFIFFTIQQKDTQQNRIKQKQLLKLYHLESYRLLNEKEIIEKNISGLPNADWPSDHFSLVSKFCLTT